MSSKEHEQQAMEIAFTQLYDDDDSDREIFKNGWEAAIEYMKMSE